MISVRFVPLSLLYIGGKGEKPRPANMIACNGNKTKGRDDDRVSVTVKESNSNHRQDRIRITPSPFLPTCFSLPRRPC